MAPQAEAKRAAVLGFPISHSLSPRLHNYWLHKYNISGSYEAIAVPPADLAKALDDLCAQNYAGVNLTIPLKEAALTLMEEIDGDARSIGAVNTIVISSGKLLGRNTDAYGFMENLRTEAPQLSAATALVMGAGGAARAVCAGLLKDGWKVTIAGRTRRKAELVANQFRGGIETLEWQQVEKAMKDTALLVNTTPLGMKGQSPLDIKLGSLPIAAAVCDIVYNPLVTPLLETARARGNTVVGGLGMLLYQAQPAFEAWFGIRPEVTPELVQHMTEALP